LPEHAAATEEVPPRTAPLSEPAEPSEPAAVPEVPKVPEVAAEDAEDEEEYDDDDDDDDDEDEEEGDESADDDDDDKDGPQHSMRARFLCLINLEGFKFVSVHENSGDTLAEPGPSAS